MLEIKNLSKSFHENKVLDHINLKIEKAMLSELSVLPVQENQPY